ncbi:MAG: glycosyltransferase family 4 protein [Isosphaeraceae bacterium]|nr:glycosyltransferase family 4 protein [Isosphaeraceae bacterium]
MADRVRNVLLLAGRLGSHDHGWPVLSFLDRLAQRGVSAQVLCHLSSGPAGCGPADRIIECPGLFHHWQQALAIRRLRLGEGLRRPDLVHALQAGLAPAALALAERWGVPYVLTIDEYVGPGSRLRVSRRWCRRLIAASRALATELTGQLDVPPTWLSVVPPGIETGPEPALHVRPREVPVIGTAGPLVDESGFATFLNAARRVLEAGLDAEFVIAGLGPDEADLRRRADRLGITDRVTFAGIPAVGLRFWDVLGLYCQTATVPTVGRTLALAMAHGVPSIATDVEGLRALVAHDETGLRVPPENSGALADAILTLLKDPVRAHRLGHAARALIQRDFDPLAEVDSLVAVYRDVLGAEAPCPAAALA